MVAMMQLALNFIRRHVDLLPCWTKREEAFFLESRQPLMDIINIPKLHSESAPEWP